MTTITIPQKTANEEKLIAVPSKIYGEFLAWQKKIKAVKTFKPTASEKKALGQGRKNLNSGNYVSLEKLRYELELNN